VVLHREDRPLAVPEPLAGAIVEIHMRRFPAELGHRRRIDREAVVLRGDLDLPGRRVLDRVVRAVMTEGQLVGAPAGREAEDLVAEADTEDRQAPEEVAHRLDQVVCLNLVPPDPARLPPEDPQSNYRMALETFFRFIRTENRNVLRMRGEIDPSAAAREYQQKIDELAKERRENIYRHDLVLLGVGDDGHTASLFPGTDAVENTSDRVVANFVPKFDAWRLTMTFPLLNQARCVCFLVNAAKNPELIEHVIAGDQQYPAARVQPTSGRLVWILGEKA